MPGDVSIIRQFLGQVLKSLPTLRSIPAMGTAMLVSLYLLDEKRARSLIIYGLVAKIGKALDNSRPKVSELSVFLR